MKQTCLLASLAISLLFTSALRLHAQEDWKAYQSKEGRCAVVLPVEPTASAKDVETEIGVIKMTMLIAEISDSVVYMVTFNDYPEALVREKGGEQVMDDACEGMANKGKLRSKKEIKFVGFSAREVIIDNDQGLTIKARAVLVNNRLYQVLSVGPARKEDNQDTARFLDSFKLTK